MENSLNNQFDYFISSKDNFLVITFSGMMDGKSIEKLAEIKSSVLANEAAKFIILNFKDTSMISGEAVTLLAQLQMNIRAKKLHLRLCGLKNDLIQKLLMSGVIRNSEVTADLQSALQNLIEHRK